MSPITVILVQHTWTVSWIWREYCQLFNNNNNNSSQVFPPKSYRQKPCQCPKTKPILLNRNSYSTGCMNCALLHLKKGESLQTCHFSARRTFNNLCRNPFFHLSQKIHMNTLIEESYTPSLYKRVTRGIVGMGNVLLRNLIGKVIGYRVHLLW